MTDFLESLGARAARRAEPRASIALAGAGCALAVVGVTLLAGDAGDGTSGFNRIPGLVLTAVLVAAGLFTLHQVRRGPVATAGAVATALGIPLVVGFAILGDSEGSFQSALVLTTVLWGVAYAAGPGRGRPVFLGLGLYGLWSSVLSLVGSPEISFAPVALFTAGPGFFTESAYTYGGSYSGSGDGYTGGVSFGPDFTTIGVISLAVGIAYLLLSRRLDRAGHRGMATPFTVVALFALAEGVFGLGVELDIILTGLLITVVGVGLVLHGATLNRRFTAWLGALVAVAGVVVFLSDLIDDLSVAGVVFTAAGVGVVAGAEVLSRKLDEADEMEPMFERPRRRQLVAEPRPAE